MRDSKAAEEEDWIAKNRRHLKHHAVYKNSIPKGNGIDEEDATWLKAKGDDFFRGGDFRSAINAYSSALEMDEHQIGCYANRAACYLKLNLPYDCKADCSSGISEIVGYHNENKMEDILEEFKGTLIKLYLRRSVVSTQLGSFSEALIDCQTAKDRVSDFYSAEDALTSLPNGIKLDDISTDIEKLENLVSADKLKKQADASFGDGEIEAAISKYTEALAMVPCHVSCLSNRSACYMTRGDISRCVEDCSLALEVLEMNMSQIQKVGGDNAQLTMASAVIPPAGSVKRKDWTLKTLARRGAANIQLGKIDDAIRDYGFAVSIDPSNEALKADLTKLKNTHEFTNNAPPPVEAAAVVKQGDQ